MRKIRLAVQADNKYYPEYRGGRYIGLRRVCVCNRGGRNYHRFLKRRRNKLERMRAKLDPECLLGYGKYAGYET